MERKRRIGQFKEDDEYNKPGRDFKEVVTNFRKYTTRTEFTLFLGIPIIVSVLVFVYLGIFVSSNKSLLSHIMELNQSSLTVIAILAGFNTTSLAIIAASNNKVLQFLKRHKLKDSNDTVLKQLVSFFSFAILLQLIVLVIGLLLSLITKSFAGVTQIFPLLSGSIVKYPLIAMGTIWLAFVLFTIVISIRNATLLYRYVLFIADYQEDE